MTGHVRDGVIAFAYAATVCGKTTFLEVLKKAPADHAKTTSSGTPTATKHAHPDVTAPETARLADARIVVAAETPNVPTLSAGPSERSTGGDTIEDRAL